MSRRSTASAGKFPPDQEQQQTPAKPAKVDYRLANRPVPADVRAEHATASSCTTSCCRFASARMRASATSRRTSASTSMSASRAPATCPQDMRDVLSYDVDHGFDPHDRAQGHVRAGRDAGRTASPAPCWRIRAPRTSRCGWRSSTPARAAVGVEIARERPAEAAKRASAVSGLRKANRRPVS